MPRFVTVQDWIVRGGMFALAGVGLWIVAAWVVSVAHRGGDAESSPSGPASTAPVLGSRDARDRSVCERTRARVQRGGTVTPADVDGWVVELLMLRPPTANPLLEDPTMDELLTPIDAGGGFRLAADTVPELAGLEGPDTLVTVHDATLRASSRGTVSREGVRLTFGGRYVIPYFGSSTRPAYFRLATLVADRLDVSHAALYARCKHETSHYLGSWFRGSSVPNALAALLLSMGLFATTPHVSADNGSAPSPYRLDSLLRIEKATQSVTTPDLALALGRTGGVVGGRRGHHVTVMFPFDDGNRASRASRASALALGLLDSRGTER